MMTQEEAPAAAEGGSFAGRKFGEFMGNVGVFFEIFGDFLRPWFILLCQT